MASFCYKVLADITRKLGYYDCTNDTEKVDDAVNELEGIDLTDPDLHKAATKIQASFRGHKVRQDVDIPKK
ncbi:hypothetical protein PV325_002499 [Microctonus aethiopoides]|nr:hypothetical protein PV325_002499 [Microctonus aethiopoides]KAK0091352.1 hypothetical protein PV326_003344 [Microctonus aethiopoides]